MVVFAIKTYLSKPTGFDISSCFTLFFHTFRLHFTMKVLDGSHERAMLAWANSWISDRLDRMSKQGDSPNYECGGSCGSAKGAQQLTFMYGSAAVRWHVCLVNVN